MKPIILHPEAKQEVLEIINWYFEESESVAWLFTDYLNDSYKHIQERPKAWPEYLKVFRKKLLPKFPYCIIYEELETKIKVYAVAHNSRKPNYWLKRIK